MTPYDRPECRLGISIMPRALYAESPSPHGQIGPRLVDQDGCFVPGLFDDGLHKLWVVPEQGRRILERRKPVAIRPPVLCLGRLIAVGKGDRFCLV